MTVDCTQNESVSEKQLLDEIMLGLGSILDAEYLRSCENVILHCIMQYEIKQKVKKELPAEFTMLNQKVKNDFLISKKLEGLSMHSLELYKCYLDIFISSINTSVLLISDIEIQYALYMYEQRGVSKVTVNNYRACIKSFFTWMQIKHIRIDNPMLAIKKIKFESKEKLPFSKIEIQKLKDSAITAREKLIIHLLLSTGIRCEELVNIKLTDIDFNEKKVLIHGKGSYQRINPFNDVCNMYLEEYMQYRYKNGIVCEYLLCSERRYTNSSTGELEYHKLSTGTINEIIKHIASRCGVENAHPHRFRRTFCCAAVDTTDILTASKLLGHHNLNTTKIYTVTNPKKIDYEYGKINV